MAATFPELPVQLFQAARDTSWLALTLLAITLLLSLRVQS